MRITSLSISNYKALRKVTLENLNQMVLIAGPNGCGKSCIYDAIRLLKSIYGEHSQNEIQKWFSEFGINYSNNAMDILKVFHDKTLPVLIQGVIQFCSQDLKSIRRDVRKIARKAVVRRRYNHPMANSVNMELDLISNPLNETEKRDIASYELELDACLSAETVECKVEISIGTDGKIEYYPNTLVSAVFSNMDGGEYGVIDYHSANRNYGREAFDTVQLNSNRYSSSYYQHALYDTTNKYSNVKRELGSDYIIDKMYEIEHPTIQRKRSVEVINELFRTFIPDKEFLGPRFNESGKFDFLVRTHTGALHDIDDLSAGEKEIIYGYLRLRRAAPKNSILLFDEPELHLNPRLIKGLPRLYYENIGLENNNQLWMITHSDALLKDAIGNDSYSLFHLSKPSATTPLSEQANTISLADDFRNAVVSMSGDIAVYVPEGNILLIEGGSDTEFDKFMITELFPEVQRRANIISCGKKRDVLSFHATLKRLSESGFLPTKVFAITDRDHDLSAMRNSDVGIAEWDRYCIENYLLDPEYIIKAISDNSLPCHLDLNTGVILNLIKECARQVVEDQIQHMLKMYVDRQIRDSLSIDVSGYAKTVVSSIDSIVGRVNLMRTHELSREGLDDYIKNLREQLHRDIETHACVEVVSGKVLLPRVGTRLLDGVKYPVFRNMIVAAMRRANHQPLGMRKIIDMVLSVR